MLQGGQRQRTHPHDAAALLAVLAGGRPGHLGRRLGVDWLEPRSHGVDGLSPFVDLRRVDEVGDGADPDHLGGQVAEHLLGSGGEEGHRARGVYAHDGAARSGAQQGFEAVAGVIRLSGVPSRDARLLRQVAQDGAVARDHRVDGRGDQRGDRRHDGHLPPLERRVVGGTDDQQRHQERQVEAEEPDEEVQPPSVERQPDDRQQIDDDQPRVRPALCVPDDRDDSDVADRDDQPGPVGQPFPRNEECGRHEREEKDAGDGDLAAGVVRERDDRDQDRADRHEGEHGQTDAHRPGKADG